ncbi:MAG TPA: GPW/gp25 family protein [Tepidiformaceae bacterium]|nr:GPW/gp25 family protein [Tepidiformaceae bacterium]
MSTDRLIGRGWTFPVNVDSRGGVSVSAMHDEIEQAIRIIIGTSPGERVMRPTFGCRIHELVFAPNDPSTYGLARRYILEALGMWEPRIEVVDVTISPTNAERRAGVLIISVSYLVRATKDARTLVYPFYLIEPE